MKRIRDRIEEEIDWFFIEHDFWDWLDKYLPSKESLMRILLPLSLVSIPLSLFSMYISAMRLN